MNAISAVVTPPRGAPEDEDADRSPPSKETRNTTKSSDCVDGSPYAEVNSVAVINPADGNVVVVGGKRKRGRSRQRKQQKRIKSTTKTVSGGCRMIPSSVLSILYDSSFILH